ncbi:MAG TPA: hypothetical protein VER03_26600 [Bryobacteraceae bacterium]|nr:hypothetical protein [Bryobacteraceae bacterium]
MDSSDFFLAGWRVRSHFSLPELLPWAGDPHQSVDLLISAAEGVPDVPSQLVFDNHVSQVAPDRSCWVTLPGIARFFIHSDATQIHVAAYRGDPAAPAVRLFLLSTVLAIVCHRRGLLPMHASCVEIGGRAVLFTGPTCAGKSLLAAAFLRAGCRVLSDDIAVLNVAAPTGPAVLPSFPRLRLWRSALNELGFSLEDLRRSRPELEKYDISTENAFIAQPRPLTAMYHLRRWRKGIEVTTTRLYAARAMRDAAQAVYCAQPGRALDPEPASTQRIAGLCSGASSHILYCKPGLDSISAIITNLLQEHNHHL